jgi:4-oxalomesaconate tautomerase
MNLGDVANKSVTKMMLVTPPKLGGAMTVGSFIPYRAHATIDVFGAVGATTACMLSGSHAADVANIPAGDRKVWSIVHPTGEITCVLELGTLGAVQSAELLRTARKLMNGIIFS